MKNNRRGFLASIGAASLGAASLGLFLGAHEAKAEEVESDGLEGRDIYVTATNTIDGSRLGEFYISHEQRYPAFTVQSPRKGELIVRVAPYRDGLVEVTILRPNGDLVHHSFSGVDTSLSFYGSGFSLVIGMAPVQSAIANKD